MPRSAEQTAPTAPPRVASVGVLGARGFVGAELLRLVAGHPRLALAHATSSGRPGAPLPGDIRTTGGATTYIGLDEALAVSPPPDVLLLALPNGAAAELVRSGRVAAPLVVDVSADHRFDAGWAYGLPEVDDGAIAGAERIANPGCYATAMMLALHPVADLLDGPPHCFGVSGYSGAGATPSPRNDPERLRDNLVPYQLADHVHEREVSHRLGRRVHFMPHVGAFFRGISVTASLRLREPIEPAGLIDRYATCYAAAPLVNVVPDDTPLLRDAVGRNAAWIGGFTVSAGDPRDVRVVATLDNLLKGAATQAIQNINIALGYDPAEGLSA